jgi:H+/Cl- antiporter ClcA/CBS domain-containing protein
VSPATARRADHLGDFTLSPRVLLITALALAVGGASAVAAFCLLRLIGLITNAVFYQRISTALTAPGAIHHPAWLILLAPVTGGLIVGLMARYGSEKIRGHGMPEAIDAILTGGSRIAPRVAILKPVSAAISIGTGGPFGAEGPIIMTGGAIGSILAQFLRLSADERKTLLVAGAAGGMAATFNAPLASVLLAVELLLFEWRPRSIIPVSAAVTVATLCRWGLLGAAPVFPVTAATMPGTGAIVLALVPGLTGGLLAVGVTALVYKSEDAFSRLPVHWMWWPAIGGLIIGLGGLIEPRALGVGYDVIDQLLTGRAALSLIVGILVIKTLIWSLSLGSGTSGGVLAPVFMIGGALGALEGQALPHVFAGFWAMMGLAAVVGGVMRSPLTGVVFTLELTHAWNSLLALLVASVSAYALSALILKRSVLTEKVARRGIHLTREYSTDPLEVFFAWEVMRPTPPSPERSLLTVHADATLREVANALARHEVTTAAVVDRRAPGAAVGEITLAQLLHARRADLREDEDRQRFFGVGLTPLAGRRGRAWRAFGADRVAGIASQEHRLGGGDEGDAAEHAEREGVLRGVVPRRTGKQAADPQRDGGERDGQAVRQLGGGREQGVGVPHLVGGQVGEPDRVVDGQRGRADDPADQGEDGDDRQRGGVGGEREPHHREGHDHGRDDEHVPEAEPVDQRRGRGLDPDVAREDEQHHRA